MQRALSRSAAARRLEDGPADSDTHGRRGFIRAIRRRVVAAVGGAVALTDAAAVVLISGIGRAYSGRTGSCRQLHRRDEKAEACVKKGS
ncbi:MAG: hypothetical protein P8127_02905 [Acidobacteriota bacterium]